MLARSDWVPLGSPMLRRLPEMWVMWPGAVSSTAG